MYFTSLNEFLAMGGHGLYVWLSYGIFIAVLTWNILGLRSNRRLSIKRAQKTWARSNNGQDNRGKESTKKTAEDSSL